MLLAQDALPNELASWGRQLTGADWWIIISYFVLMLGIGVYFYRFMRGMKDYFRGGSTIPWWLSGISYWMTSFSAFAFVYYSGLSYKYGLVGVTMYWVTVPATLVSLLFFAGRWRRARIDSPVEFIESRYSPFLRQLFAWQGIPVKIIDDGLKIVAIGKFISIGLHLDMTQAMIWSSVIMLAYTFLGGLWAATITDFVQFVVMMAAVVILFPLVFGQVGGVVHYFQNAPAEFLRFTNEKYTGYYVAGLVLMYCLSFSVNWSLIQRFYCVPTEKDARKCGWLVVGLNIIGPPLLFMPAIAASKFLGPGLPEDSVYPLMCAKLLPAGMFGLVIVAMFSATMSTLSGDSNVVASVLTNDVYRRLIRPQASNRELVHVGRAMTLVVGFGALAVAFMVKHFRGEKQFQNMVTLFSIAVAPVAVPMLSGLVSRKVTTRSAIIGFLSGIFVGLALLFTLPEEVSLFGRMWQRETVLTVSGLLATVIALLSDLKIHPMTAAEAQRIEPFHVKLETPIGGMEEDMHVISRDPNSGPSPFRIVGVTLIITGIMLIGVQPWVRTVEGVISKGSLPLVLNLTIAIALLLLGGIMVWTTRKPRPQPSPAVAVES